ncbi:efflux RND transporter periplasmic adaptor subunit [Thermosynechococcaceae cyanobacterium BACA0444]|uniref:Efflux RND transporter periplasmic adaptor subunit n=1 Tax=Pseudocalidococcus azoricus BACA0444 TaxID=2918990 RepID=A0AAE4JWW0_9CYAN|nr:efflux RND transporter periplasmic adaptor subunit [Pseudocalidococcus azoricus]MDS3861461.1 efflux RND transporter periplasmic adaptor subunit [Pseudocalidococcus azoricus BACA0444]
MNVFAQGILIVALAWGSAGCQTSLSPNATARPVSAEIPVDLAVAKPGTLGSRVTFTGTTRPNQDVVLRAQVEGQVLSLGVDVGDRVAQGQVLARLDAALLRAAVIEAESELAARRSEVVQAQAQVNNARIAVEQARLNLQQSQSDAARLKQLLASGAIAAQTAEQAETTAQTQRQVLASTQAQVQTAQEGVAIAQGRVQAQAAIVKQTQARLQYALIRSPLNGVVLERLTETGNLVQPGNELLRIGNLNQLRVVVELSEREAADLGVGQSAEITLDAAPNETLSGRVSRISPAAEATARLVPVEILINNPQQRFGSGQLARVTFQGETQARIVVPQSALAGEQEGNVSAKEGQVYVVTNNQVEVRAVELGNRRNGQVEIVTGLNPGERYVVRSGRPLKSGDTVRVSVLSER